MTKDRLIKRLSWYYPTELFNAFLFTGVLAYVIGTYGLRETVFLSYGLVVMVVILFEGQHYWKLKLYRLQGRPFDMGRNLTLFRKLEHLNRLLIALMPLALLIQLYLNGWAVTSWMLFGWGVAANLFAVAEHINYYHRQLMIDNPYDVRYVLRNRRLKVASLRKDLKEGKF